MRFLKNVKLSILPSISKKGTEASCVVGDYVTKAKFPSDVSEKWFPTDTTLLMGVRPDPTKSFIGCEAVWKFNVSHIHKKKLVSANLRIITFRTHAGISVNYDLVEGIDSNEAQKYLEHQMLEVREGTEHRLKKVLVKKGYVLINDRLVDEIDLVPPVPTGRYHGFNKLEPFPIVTFIKEAINEKKDLVIKLKVDPMVYWDIDEITIDSLVIEESTFKGWLVQAFLLGAGATLGVYAPKFFGWISKVVGGLF